MHTPSNVSMTSKMTQTEQCGPGFPRHHSCPHSLSAYILCPLGTDRVGAWEPIKIKSGKFLLWIFLPGTLLQICLTPAGLALLFLPCFSCSPVWSQTHDLPASALLMLKRQVACGFVIYIWNSFLLFAFLAGVYH